MESFDDDFVESAFPKAQRDFIDREILVLFLDHRFDRNIAKEGDLLSFLLRNVLFASADEDIGLNTDLSKQANGVLGWFGFEFCRGFEVGDKRQMDKEAVLLANFLRKLTNGLQKRQALDISNGSTDFSNDDIGGAIGHSADDPFDLVGDVRDDLNSFTEKLTVSFLFDHGQIDLTGCVIRISSQRSAGEAFVVSQVQIGFTAIIEDINFPVLIGAHRPGIDIDIGVEFLHADAEAARFQQHSNGSAGEPFPIELTTPPVTKMCFVMQWSTAPFGGPSDEPSMRGSEPPFEALNDYLISRFDD